jgi:IclR family acetate operon transcriptional repressor
MDGWERTTTRTIATTDALEQELAAIRRRGVAFDRGESRPSVCCVAASVDCGDPSVSAAVSVSAPLERFRPEELAQAIQLCGRAVERAMGRL